MRDAALHCSEIERESMKIERDADDVCAAFLLERELGADGDREKSFDGEVSGVIRSGVFVAFGGELGDVYEGFLPARRLRGEDFSRSTRPRRRWSARPRGAGCGWATR